MLRKLEESLKDLQDTVFYIEKAADCLLNISNYGEGGNEIKLLRHDLLELVDKCKAIHATWALEG